MRGVSLSQSLALSIKVPGQILSSVQPGVRCGGALWVPRRSPGQEEVGYSADPEEGVQPQAPSLGGLGVPAYLPMQVSASVPGEEKGGRKLCLCTCYVPGPGIPQARVGNLA